MPPRSASSSPRSTAPSPVPATQGGIHDPIRDHLGNAPGALGPYSQGIATDGLVFCSGQIGIDPATGELLDGIEAQTDRALRNLAAVLDAAGASFGIEHGRQVAQGAVGLASMPSRKLRRSRGRCPICPLQTRGVGGDALAVAEGAGRVAEVIADRVDGCLHWVAGTGEE